MHRSYDEEDEGTPEWVVPDVDPDQARREDAEEHRSGGLMAVWRRVRRALAGSHRDPAQSGAAESQSRDLTASRTAARSWAFPSKSTPAPSMTSRGLASYSRCHRS